MRKTLLIITVSILSTFCAHSQIQKGARLIGGSIGVTTSESDASPGNNNNQVTSFQFLPSFGYAIKTNLIIGGDLMISGGKNESYSNTQKSNGWGAGFFVRRYLTLGKGFYIFGQGRFGFAHNETSSSSNLAPNVKVTNETSSVGLSIYPGVSYAINKKWQLELGLNDLLFVQYSKGRTESNNPVSVSTYNNFGLGTNFSGSTGVNVGLRMLLNK